jgi:hypothetical protein
VGDRIYDDHTDNDGETTINSVATSNTFVTQNSFFSHRPSSSQLPLDFAKTKIEKHVQPEAITFPSQMFGTAKRLFQSS